MVPLTDVERQEYDAHRKAYTDFIAKKKISMHGGGWTKFH